MKKALTILLSLISFCCLTGCRQVDVARVAYQQVYIYDFSEPRTFEFDATADWFVSYYSVNISGTVSTDVVLSINYSNDANRWVPVTSIEPIRLSAGTYTNKAFRGDYYAPNKMQLVVTAPQTAAGSLSIEWGVN